MLKKKSARRPATRPTSAAPSQSGAIALRRVSKGTRPRFYENEAVDQLFAIVTALSAEVSVAFDRIDTLERVLATTGVIRHQQIESFVPDREVAEERGLKREQRIQRIFAVLEASGAGKSR